MDKFDEFAATAPPRPPTAPGGLDFYGIRPLAGAQQTPPMRLPTDQVGPDTRSNPRGLTVLSPDEEKQYAAWRATLPKELQYEGDYDLKGFFKKNPTFHADPGQHMTDEFKLPNHPTFSNESKYYDPSTARMGGHWAQDVYVPNDTHYKQRVDETPPRKPARKRRAIP